MTRSDWFMGVATTFLAIIAGTISFDYVNRRYPAATPDRSAERNDAQQTSPAVATSPGACIDADGSWKNWSYPNVPILSPKCDSAK